MDYKKLDELNKLRQSGALTDEEFEREKQKFFEEEALNSSRSTSIPLGLQESSYLALMNFLILIPSIGWLIPIVLWVMGKDSSERINAQGKYILNWYITWFILGALLIITTLILLIGGGAMHPSAAIGGFFIGGFFWIPIVAIFGILALAFPIIGGIKGLNGQVWKYPLSIPFFK